MSDVFVGVICSDKLKYFSSSLLALAKIGRDISFEITSTSFLVRTLNDSISVCAEMEYQRIYFDQYTIADNVVIKCKCLLRNCLSAFKNLRSINRLTLSVEQDEYGNNVAVRFQSACTADLTKTHRIGIYDCESSRVNLSPHECANKICARSGHLNLLLKQLIGTEEISMSLRQKE
jgi:hypothetical protein